MSGGLSEAVDFTLSQDLTFPPTDIGLGSGGVTISFDPAYLTYVSFVFDPSLQPNDLGTVSPPTANSVEVVWGTFFPPCPNTPCSDGIDGTATIGTLTMMTRTTTTGPQGTDVELSHLPIGNVFLTQQTNTQLDPTFYGANVQVVPLPAAGWLLLSGLAGLGICARKKKYP